MKLIQLTARKFKTATADGSYSASLAERFYNILKDNHLLIVANKPSDKFKNINCIDLNINPPGRLPFLYYWLPFMYYFFWLPYFIVTDKNSNNNTVFFSNDPMLLILLIFYKKIFFFKYRICSDWHRIYHNWKDKYIISGSDKLIATSQKLKNLILDAYKILPDRILVVYGGIDLEKYKNIEINKAREELQLPKDKKIVGYVGYFITMKMEKGIGTMIESLKYLGNDIVMAFVGGGESEIEYYKKMASNLGVEKKCLFYGYKNFNEVNLFEQAMNILVIPYPDKPHFRLYGFPMKVYEYMASKRPIIYSKLDLAEEVIGDCALGFKADNAKDLAEKIIEIEKNKAHYSALAEKAYSKVKKYSWQKKAEKIINFIKAS